MTMIATFICGWCGGQLPQNLTSIFFSNYKCPVVKKNGECFYHPEIHHFDVTNVTDVSKLVYVLHLFSIYFISQM